MPVWQTSTGVHGSIQVISDSTIPLKDGKEKWIPGFRLPLQRAWVTIEISDGLDVPANATGKFPRVAPEYIDTDHLPPGVLINLKKAAQYRDGWKDDPMKSLIKWLDGPESTQFYGLERGDPRGGRPVKMVMTAEEYEKFLKAKADGTLDVNEISTTHPVGNAAQKVHQGTRVTK